MTHQRNFQDGPSNLQQKRKLPRRLCW